MRTNLLSSTSGGRNLGFDSAIGQIDLIGGKGEIVRSWRIRTPRCTVGSAPECGVQLSDDSISPLHATLVFGKKHTLLRAHGPTRIGNRNVREWLIDTPTEIWVGSARLVVHPSIGVMATVVHAEKLIEQASRLCKQSSLPVQSNEASNGEEAILRDRGENNPLDSNLQVETPMERVVLSQISDLVVQSEWDPPYPIQDATAWIKDMSAFKSTDILAPAVDPELLEPKSLTAEREKIQQVQSKVDLDGIEKLLTALQSSLEKMHATLSEEAKQSTQVIAESVSNEIGTFGKTWFASFNEKLDNQSAAQQSLLTQFSGQFSDRLGAIDHQLSQMHEHSTRHAEQVLHLLEQAQSAKARIDSRLSEVLANRNELVAAVDTLRGEIANAFSQEGVQRASSQNPEPSECPPNNLLPKHISDEVLAESLERAHLQLQDYNQQVKGLQSERDYTEQQIHDLAIELRTSEEASRLESHFDTAHSTPDTPEHSELSWNSDEVWNQNGFFASEVTVSDTDSSFAVPYALESNTSIPEGMQQENNASGAYLSDAESSNANPSNGYSYIQYGSASFSNDEASQPFDREATGNEVYGNEVYTEDKIDSGEHASQSPAQLPSWYLGDNHQSDDESIHEDAHYSNPYSLQEDEANPTSFSTPDLSSYSDDPSIDHGNEADSRIDEVHSNQALPNDEPLGTDTDAISHRLQRMLEDADHRRGGSPPKPSEPISSRRWSQTYSTADRQSIGSKATDVAEDFQDQGSLERIEPEYDAPLSVSFPIEDSLNESEHEETISESPTHRSHRQSEFYGSHAPDSQHVSEPNSHAQHAASSTNAASESEEESIEEYMQRLLTRVRSGPTESSFTPPSPVIAPKPARNDVPATSAAAEATPNPTTSSNTDASTIRKTRPIQSEAFVPRKQAPEQRTELDALRELANSNARRAITRSQIRRTNSAFWFKFSITVVAIFSAVALFMLNGLEINMPFAGMISAIVVAFLWGFDCIQQLRKIKESGRTRVTIESVQEEKRQIRNSAPPSEPVTEDRWRPSQA